MRSLGMFAINLDRSAGRWAALDAAFSPLPYPLERVAALDAAQAPAEVLAVRNLAIALPPAGLGYSLVRGREYLLVQEACFASHIVALRRFLASGLDLGLILEDDAQPDGSLAPVLAALRAGHAPFDIIRLEAIRSTGRRLAVPVAALGPSMLVRSLQPSSGSAAYVVTPDAARRLVARAGRMLLPYDDYLSNPLLHGCDVAYVSPLPIRQAETESVIAQSYDRRRLRRQRGPWPFVRQAVVRARLRGALWLRALRGLPGLYRW